MLIQFQIEYRTYFGQQVMISGSLPQLGDGKREHAVAMIYSENSYGIWRFQIETGIKTNFNYRYFIRENNDKTETDEWGENRQFISENIDHGPVFLIDHWRTRSDPDYALLSFAFTKAIFRQGKLPQISKKGKTKAKNTILLRFIPSISRVIHGHRIAVAGSPESMGAWKENKTVPLWSQNFPEWKGEVAVPVSDFPVKYKYLIQDEKNETLFWEKCDNRIIALPEGDLPGIIEIRDEKFDYPQLPWKGAGLAIPVFSLRRKEGFGVGEFTDLKLLTDWALEAGMQMIQILPVNDTVARHSWQDSYPYAAISVFALHPVYINLTEIGKLDSETTNRIIEKQGRFLNKQDKIDYEAVMSLKSRFFKLIYDQQKAEFLADPGFIAFFENNKGWLKPYAAFSYLRDLYNTPDFSRWNEFSEFNPELLEGLTDPSSPHYDDIAIHYFIQYHAHLQLHNASEYARSKGVVLKGDLPIGIYRNSVDAWVNPELYHMDCQAGAPLTIFRRQDKTGNSRHITGKQWQLTITHGGNSGCNTCRAILMLSGLTISWDSSGYGKYRHPRCRD